METFTEGIAIEARCEYCKWYCDSDSACREDSPPFERINKQEWCRKFTLCFTLDKKHFFSIKMPGEDIKCQKMLSLLTGERQ